MPTQALSFFMHDSFDLLRFTVKHILQTLGVIHSKIVGKVLFRHNYLNWFHILQIFGEWFGDSWWNKQSISNFVVLQYILVRKISIIMMTSSNGNIFRVTGHVCGEFIGSRWIPRTKAGDAELWCLRLNKRLSKQSGGWWFETLSSPLWRHCNGLSLYIII